MALFESVGQLDLTNISLFESVGQLHVMNISLFEAVWQPEVRDISLFEYWAAICHGYFTEAVSQVTRIFHCLNPLYS
jgi:hypothetical protein